MMDEDLSVFFDADEFAVECSNNGHDFMAMLNEPQGMESYDQADLIVSTRSITAPTVDIEAAAVVQGGNLMVDGTTYKVRFTQRGGDAALTRVELGAVVTP